MREGQGRMGIGRGRWSSTGHKQACRKPEDSGLKGDSDKQATEALTPESTHEPKRLKKKKKKKKSYVIMCPLRHG